MIEYIITCAAPIWTAECPRPPNWVMPRPGVYQWLEDPTDQVDFVPDILTYPPIAAASPVVVGGWHHSDGSIAHVLDAAEYDVIAPTGNLPDGSATDALLAPTWQGQQPRKLDGDSYFPPGVTAPWDIEARHHWYDYDPPWAGWGIRWEMHGDVGSIDPTGRAIARYDEPECVTFAGTMGGFVQDPSAWQVDASGNPLTVWVSNTPPGECDADDKSTVHYSVLNGPTQEGHSTITPEIASQRQLFWENNQPAPGGEWVDSGETVTGMAATVTLVSNVAPFPVGALVRIETVEMTVGSIWAGQGLVLNPYRVSTTGAGIEVWE